MKILVLNSGSSSLKYSLYEMPQERICCKGLIEKINDKDCHLKHEKGDKVFQCKLASYNHEQALEKVANILLDDPKGELQKSSKSLIIGHRIVHGGETLTSSIQITEKSKSKIKALFPLAPLHNPANLKGIEIAENIFPKAKQIAVFDTAFHQTIPEPAFRYAIPKVFYEKYAIRKYGFHGSSHQFVSRQAINIAKLDPTSHKIISIHLGNGCSICAIENGKSIDTSMGLGPLSGLIMGTRSGDIDPSVIFQLNELGYSVKEVQDILNKKSGLLGMSGQKDMREVRAMAEMGNMDAQLILNMYSYRIRKYIGAYSAIMNGLDAIIFTGGVGENDAKMRLQVCEELDFLGITMDREKNLIPGKRARDISSGKTRILIIPTNEELEIARQCYEN